MTHIASSGSPKEVTEIVKKIETGRLTSSYGNYRDRIEHVRNIREEKQNELSQRHASTIR